MSEIFPNFEIPGGTDLNYAAESEHCFHIKKKNNNRSLRSYTITVKRSQLPKYRSKYKSFNCHVLLRNCNSFFGMTLSQNQRAMKEHSVLLSVSVMVTAKE